MRIKESTQRKVSLKLRDKKKTTHSLASNNQARKSVKSHPSETQQVYEAVNYQPSEEPLEDKSNKVTEPEESKFRITLINSDKRPKSLAH